MSCFHPLIFPSARLHLPSTDFHRGRQSFAGADHWAKSQQRPKSVGSPHVHVGLQEGVDAVDYPAEEASVQGLGHGVADVGGFVHGVGADDGLAPGDHTLGGQRLLELLRSNTEEGRS